MRYFLLLLFCLIAVLCNAQETPGFSDTPPYTDGLDTINRHFILSLNFGVDVPLSEYSTPPLYFNSNTLTQYSEIYGYASTGEHLDLTGIYLPLNNLGLAARFATDINSTISGNTYNGRNRNIVNQYLGGLYIQAKYIKSNFNVYFMLLFGEITANIPGDNNSFFNDSQVGSIYGTEVPGFWLRICHLCRNWAYVQTWEMVLL